MLKKLILAGATSGVFRTAGSALFATLAEAPRGIMAAD